MLNAVRTLKAKGVPVDAVGLHMHLLAPWYDKTPPTKDEVAEVIQSLAALGVDVYITEFDLDLQNIPGSQQERWQYQAKVYRDVIEACLENKACKSFDTWGISDGTSFYVTNTNPGMGPLHPNAEPLMFDTNFQPKPAYFAVRDALLAGVRVPTPTPRP